MTKNELKEMIYDLRVMGAAQVTLRIEDLETWERKDMIVERGGDNLYFGHFTHYGAPVEDENGQMEDVELAEVTFEAKAIGKLIELANFNFIFEPEEIEVAYTG